MRRKVNEKQNLKMGTQFVFHKNPKNFIECCMYESFVVLRISNREAIYGCWAQIASELSVRMIYRNMFYESMHLNRW